MNGAKKAFSAPGGATILMTHTPVAALLLPTRPASAVMPAAENRDETAQSCHLLSVAIFAQVCNLLLVHLSLISGIV